MAVPHEADEVERIGAREGWRAKTFGRACGAQAILARDHALVLPLFDGGNMGVRRRELHELMQMPNYDRSRRPPTEAIRMEF
jgi:hypothetical protein